PGSGPRFGDATTRSDSGTPPRVHRARPLRAPEADQAVHAGPHVPVRAAPGGSVSPVPSARRGGARRRAPVARCGGGRDARRVLPAARSCDATAGRDQLARRREPRVSAALSDGARPLSATDPTPPL